MPDVSICLCLVRSLISDSFVAHWLGKTNHLDLIFFFKLESFNNNTTRFVGSFVCRDLKVKVAQLVDVSTVLLLHVCLFVFFGFCSQ